MPSLVPNDVHLNQFLTNYSLAYAPADAIAGEVFKSVSVGKQTNTYAVIAKGDWLRRHNTQRAPGQAPNYVTFSVSSDTYYARNYALGTEVDYETQDNADAPHAPLQDGVRFVRDGLAIDFECRVFEKCATSCGTTITLTGADEWDQTATSDPIGVVRTAREAIRQTTGLSPNVAVVPQRAMEYLMHHPDIIRAAYPGAGVGGMVSAQKLADVWQVERVLVPKMVRNTAEKGNPTSTFTDVWSTNVFLMYANPNPGLRTATFGLAFDWTGPKIGRGGVGGFAVVQKEDEEIGATKLWSGYYRDEKVVAPELGAQILTGI